MSGHPVLVVKVVGGGVEFLAESELFRLLAVRPDTDLSRQGFELLLAAVTRGTATRFSLGRSGFAVIRNRKLSFRKT